MSLCPTRALKIVKSDHTFKENANWSRRRPSPRSTARPGSGGVLLSSMGNPKALSRLLGQDPHQRFPGDQPFHRPPARADGDPHLPRRKSPIRFAGTTDGKLITDVPPQLKLNVPIMFSAMSYGSISYNAHASLARAAQALGTYYNTGEGGLHEDFYQYGANTIVQVASGRFGVHKDYLQAGAAIEIKMGQGAKPGIGGHLPGAKIVGDVSRTRMIPEGIGRDLPRAASRYLFHRGSAPAGLLAEGGDRLQKARHRQDRGGA